MSFVEVVCSDCDTESLFVLLPELVELVIHTFAMFLEDDTGRLIRKFKLTGRVNDADGIVESLNLQHQRNGDMVEAPSNLVVVSQFATNMCADCIREHRIDASNSAATHTFCNVGETIGGLRFTVFRPFTREVSEDAATDGSSCDVRILRIYVEVCAVKVSRLWSLHNSGGDQRRKRLV